MKEIPKVDTSMFDISPSGQVIPPINKRTVEIQEAFEKHILSTHGSEYGNLERWRPEWTTQYGVRYYANAIIEQDFAFFRAGYIAGIEAERH